MLRSSLVVRSREVRKEVALHQGQATSLEGKVSCVQTLGGELEKQLAEARAQDQQALDELTKIKED